MHSQWRTTRQGADSRHTGALDASIRLTSCASRSAWLALCLLVATLPGVRDAIAQEGASDTRIQRIADLAKSAEEGPTEVARLPQRDGTGRQAGR